MPGSVQADCMPGSVQADRMPGSVQADRMPGSVQADHMPRSVQADHMPRSVQANHILKSDWSVQTCCISRSIGRDSKLIQVCYISLIQTRCVSMAIYVGYRHDVRVILSHH